jgi:hypothetical protein
MDGLDSRRHSLEQHQHMLEMAFEKDRASCVSLHAVAVNARRIEELEELNDGLSRLHATKDTLLELQLARQRERRRTQRATT